MMNLSVCYFCTLRTSCFVNLKGTVGLIMTKASAMRISIPLDLSSRSCVPLPHFIRSRRPTPLLAPSLVFFPPCSVSVARLVFVIFFSLTFTFFYSAENKLVLKNKNVSGPGILVLVSCPYSLPQHYMSFEAPVGAGLFTNLY